MLDNLTTCIDSLRHDLGRALSDDTILNTKGLYSLTLTLQLDLIPVIPQLAPPFLIWGRPDHNHYRIGLGIATQFEAQGKGRFEKLHDYFAQLRARWQHHSLTDYPYQPGAFCAFAFDEDDVMSGPWQGIANSLITVPEVLVEFSEGHYTLTLSCEGHQLQATQTQIEAWLNNTTTLLTAMTTQLSPSEGENTLYRAPSEPCNSDWFALVENAKDAIHNHTLTKVVPTRHVPIRAAHDFNQTAILKRLAKQYPACLLLGVSLGDRTLIAATPERLVALHNGTISCDALAGTGEAGGNANEDNLLAHRLLQDPKTRHEHQLVVDHLRQRLSRVSAHLSIPETPSVLPLGHMQHLWTPIKAQCRPGISLLELAATLHPTPAVAGTPVEPARQWITENETFTRGWYCGGIGWLQADGNGDLAVLLRTALLSGNSADLYAGAGVVADSDARAELDETELKLTTVIDALCQKHATNDGQQTVQQ
jgi:menaquinone-specific isochorismate synthase